MNDALGWHLDEVQTERLRQDPAFYPFIGHVIDAQTRSHLAEPVLDALIDILGDLLGEES